MTFLERDMPWYADNRDLPKPPYGRTVIYASVQELRRRWSSTINAADVIILGSFVPDGVEIARWLLRLSRGLTAFYDVDTPVTMARLEKGDADYMALDLVPQFDLYLSFTGGPTLARALPFRQAVTRCAAWRARRRKASTRSEMPKTIA